MRATRNPPLIKSSFSICSNKQRHRHKSNRIESHGEHDVESKGTTTENNNEITIWFDYCVWNNGECNRYVGVCVLWLLDLSHVEHVAIKQKYKTIKKITLMCVITLFYNDKTWTRIMKNGEKTTTPTTTILSEIRLCMEQVGREKKWQTIWI